MYHRFMTSPSGWGFLTNHAVVLVTIASGPDLTLREIADRVGLTERAVHRIVSDLADAGYLTIRKAGRRNRYEVRQVLGLEQGPAPAATVGVLAQVLGRA